MPGGFINLAHFFCQVSLCLRSAIDRAGCVRTCFEKSLWGDGYADLPDPLTVIGDGGITPVLSLSAFLCQDCLGRLGGLSQQAVTKIAFFRLDHNLASSQRVYRVQIGHRAGLR